MNRGETGMTLLRLLFAKLFAMLWLTKPQPSAHRGSHMPISSYSRRYPGRTPAHELRRNPGWVAVMAARSHRDRRA